jgi:putative salt-induced outer membrane protein YdiY
VPGLYANADLSYVLTSGNSSTSSLGFKGDITRRFTRTRSASPPAGSARARRRDTASRSARRTTSRCGIPDAEPTAAAYYARGRYDYKLSERLFYTAGAGWERNRFSGIENRWVVDTGLGYVFLNSDRTVFRGAAGITYTSEDFTVDDGGDGSFIGGRLGWDFRHKLFATTTFTHSLIFDQSFEDGSDSASTRSSASRRDERQARAQGELADPLRQPAGLRRGAALHARRRSDRPDRARALQEDGPGAEHLARLQRRPAQEELSRMIHGAVSSRR